MKRTAGLHAAFTVLVVLGLVVPNEALRLPLFGAGAACFIAGVVVARRGDGGGPDRLGSGES